MFIDIKTDYTLLGSLIKIEDLVEYAKEKKWKWVGIADDEPGSLLDFYVSCKDEGVKPIIGLRLFVTTNIEESTIDQIILYPKNLEGYRSLLKVVSRANTDGYAKNQANVQIDWLDGYTENLLCVLPIGESPAESKTETSEKVMAALQRLFKDRLFYGLYDRNTSLDDFWLNKAAKNKTKYIPLSGCKYFKTEDYLAYRTLRAINEKSLVEKMFEPVFLNESIESAEKRIVSAQVQSALDEFVSQINLEIPCPGLKVPKFSVPKNFSSSYDYLVYLCRNGYTTLKDEFNTPEKRKQCKERMEVELDVMRRCELSDYFLLVYDICKYCDDNNIARGISRGSAGGSLVCFLLGISRVNPLTYGLLFERFLNEDRTKPLIFNNELYLTDAPDIDLDVSQLHRQQIIDFLREKYGFISKIATYTTLTSKACLKDVCRAHGRTEREAAYVAGFVEMVHGKNKKIEKTYEESKDFKEWADQNKKLYDIALKLQEVKKNKSIHAAGLLISSSNIDNYAPLCLANHTGDNFKKDTCCSYSLDISAKAGLIKVDLLGIRSLNVLQDTISLIQK